MHSLLQATVKETSTHLIGAVCISKPSDYLIYQTKELTLYFYYAIVLSKNGPLLMVLGPIHFSGKNPDAYRGETCIFAHSGARQKSRMYVAARTFCFGKVFRSQNKNKIGVATTWMIHSPDAFATPRQDEDASTEATSHLRIHL